MHLYSYWTILLIAICLLLNNRPSASQLTPEQEQEFTERLLQGLSPLCRDEVINAMNNNRNDVTEDCRMEITAFTQQHQQELMSYHQQQQDAQQAHDDTPLFDDFGNPVHTEQKIKKKRSAPLASWIHPMTAIIIFVVALFGSLAAYLVYYYQTYGFDSPAKKLKKLSKKKTEKLRQQGKLQ